MIKDLDNQEISLVYYQFKKYFDEFNSELNNGYRTESVDINGLKGMAVIKMSEKEVTAIKNSHLYLTTKSIVDKLQPVIEMIEEAQPEIKINLYE
jgi:hypothetical protein